MIINCSFIIFFFHFEQWCQRIGMQLMIILLFPEIVNIFHNFPQGEICTLELKQRADTSVNCLIVFNRGLSSGYNWKISYTSVLRTDHYVLCNTEISTTLFTSVQSRDGRIASLWLIFRPCRKQTCSWWHAKQNFATIKPGYFNEIWKLRIIHT